MWQYVFVWLVQCLIYIMIKFATWMTKIYLRSTSHEDRHFMMMPRKWLVRSVELFILWTRKYIHYCIQVNLLNRSLYITRTLETATCSMFDSDASASQSEDTQTLLSKRLSTQLYICVLGTPNSLHLFICVLFGGDLSLDMDDPGIQKDATQIKIYSIAQDIVYGLSKQNKLSPKHLALGLALHQTKGFLTRNVLQSITS